MNHVAKIPEELKSAAVCQPGKEMATAESAWMRDENHKHPWKVLLWPETKKKNWT